MGLIIYLGVPLRALLLVATKASVSHLIFVVATFGNELTGNKLFYVLMQWSAP